MPVGALLAVFGLLPGRTAAVRSRYVLLFLGLGLPFVLFVPAWGFLEDHASAGYYVVYVHNGGWFCGRKRLPPPFVY